MDEDKKTHGAATNIVEVSTSSTLAGRRSDIEGDEKWRPGVWNQFPWFGVGSLASAILLTCAIVVVLEVSDNRPVSSWPRLIPPNVIIQGLNSLATICIAAAVAQGLAVTWWRKAMHGTTVSELHHTWSLGENVLSSFFNLNVFNVAAIAVLATKLTIIDGLLLQRATTTSANVNIDPFTRNITTFPTKQLPFTGFWALDGETPGSMNNFFSLDFKYWMSSSNGYLWSVEGFKECEGLCSLKMLQPGYVATCQEAPEEEVDTLGDTLNRSSTNGTAVRSMAEIFNVNFNLTLPSDSKNYTWIGLNTTSYSPLDWTEGDTTLCPGVLYKYQCELRLAMLEYSVAMQFVNVSTGQTNQSESRVDVYLGQLNADTRQIWFDEYADEKGQIPGFEFREYIHQEENPKAFGGSYNVGIYRALQDRYRSKAWVNATAANNRVNASVGTEGTLVSQLFNWDPKTQNPKAEDCPQTYNDPMTEIMSGLNALTFIATNDLWLRPELDNVGTSDQETELYWNRTRQFQSANEWKRDIYYKTNQNFMFGGLASTLVCCLLALPAYWGFWQLGRKVTLNPIEIAAAFQAPLLDGTRSGSGHADDVVQVTGSQHIKYENITDGNAGSRLRFVAA